MPRVIKDILVIPAEVYDQASWDDAMEWADARWADCDDQASGGYAYPRKGWHPKINNKPCTPREYYLHRWQSGQVQANELKPLLKQQEHWWSNVRD